MKNTKGDAGLRILLVDDEPDAHVAIEAVLRDDGHAVTIACDGEEALRRVTSETFDVMLCDIRLPKLDGLSLFRQTREAAPDTIVILATAYAQVHDAIAAVKEGAHDYLTKPLDCDEIAIRMNRIAEQVSLRRQLAEARTQLASLDSDDPIVGSSPVMCRMMTRLNTIAGSDAPVLLLGETGTGKELVAHALHDRGPRRGKPFVTINCAAFPDTLLEAELFGYERGAFTDALVRRDGRFRAANGGTLLLDEVGDMSPAAQAKLLRVLQEGTVEPLGTNQTIRVDVRVISATNRDLRKMMANGSFREDLYYRLNVLNIDIPPLRERQGDLPLLAQFFLNKFRRPNGSPPRMSLAAWSALAAYGFPGNVRQLGHAIERAVILAGDDEVEVQHLPRDIVGVVVTPVKIETSLRPLGVAIKEFERHYLQRALAHTDGKRTVAAELLGISRKNLWEKLRSHGDGATADAHQA
ncbi:MAG TPA: sigma-54 dependent transcriptional regulator [Polyangia bacterium]|jgi:DNA-binding NtrC family response regulator|nr:sigma-54 dependent transcriptional regulator [Polyangia bacterium]